MSATGPKCPCCGQTMPPREIAVDLSANVGLFNGSRIRLQSREAEILHVLVEAWPETVTRERLSHKVWGVYGDGPSERAIETQITKLRHLLRAFRWGVKNQYGVGYRLVRL